jgi:hypothetical protein
MHNLKWGHRLVDIGQRRLEREQLQTKCGKHQTPSSEPTIGLVSIAPLFIVSQYEKMK